MNTPICAANPPLDGLINPESLKMAVRMARKIAAGLPPVFDVEDLEAAGLLGLVVAARTFDASRGIPFEAFAAVKIRGAIIDSVRGRRYRDATTGQSEDVIEESSEDVAECLLKGERRDVLRAALDKLPLQERKVMTLHYIEGESLSETAGKMGITRGRVSQIHGKALRRLRADPVLLPLAA